MIIYWILGILVLLFILARINAYAHRNDPLTREEAYAQLKFNDCCACEMCLGAHMRHGKR